MLEFYIYHKIKAEVVTFADAMTDQVDESEYINQTSEDGNLERQVLGGNTDWVSVRNKYFTDYNISRFLCNFRLSAPWKVVGIAFYIIN